MRTKGKRNFEPLVAKISYNNIVKIFFNSLVFNHQNVKHFELNKMNHETNDTLILIVSVLE